MNWDNNSAEIFTCRGLHYVLAFPEQAEAHRCETSSEITSIDVVAGGPVHSALLVSAGIRPAEFPVASQACFTHWCRPSQTDWNRLSSSLLSRCSPRCWVLHSQPLGEHLAPATTCSQTPTPIFPSSSVPEPQIILWQPYCSAVHFPNVFTKKMKENIKTFLAHVEQRPHSDCRPVWEPFGPNASCSLCKGLTGVWFLSGFQAGKGAGKCWNAWISTGIWSRFICLVFEVQCFVFLMMYN